MLLPGRHGAEDQGDGSKYRYGYQGQEKDDEGKGEGNSINYTFRMHDPRIGRFFARDPLSAKYPFYSPYQFSGNRVIDAVELEGLEPWNLNSDPSVDVGPSEYYPSYAFGPYDSHQSAYEANTVAPVELSEVTVEGKPTNYLQSKPMWNNIDDNHYQVSGARVWWNGSTAYNLIHTEGDIRAFNLDLYNESTSAAYDVGAKVSVAEAKVAGGLGNKWLGVDVGLGGSALKADINTKNGFMLGENGVYGFKSGGHAGASVLEGNASISGNLLGFTTGGDAGLTVGSAHAGYETTIMLNTNERTAKAHIETDLGLILGIELGFDLNLDYGIYMDAFEDKNTYQNNTHFK